MQKQILYRKISVLGKRLLMIFGILFLIVLTTANTSLPFWMLYDLAVSEGVSGEEPQHLILMGGSGMPGMDNLIRVYYCASAAQQYPQADIYILLPGDTTDATSDVSKIKQELILRKIDSTRIHFAVKGLNTRSQAMEIATLVDTASAVAVVSSPEHMYRSIKAFKKVGFYHIFGVPAFSRPNDVPLKFQADYGGNTAVPDIGNYTGLRYQFWVHLGYEVRVFREYAAIFYYKMKGWI